MEKEFKLLSKINYPNDLRKLHKSELKEVSSDLRNYIIESISKNGGHFGASLGVVELTLSLIHI